MEGETLYRLYCDQLHRTGGGYNVVSVTQSQGQPGPAPVEWQALPPRVKAFWHTLAQRVEDAAPRRRGPALDLRSGRYIP